VRGIIAQATWCFAMLDLTSRMRIDLVGSVRPYKVDVPNVVRVRTTRPSFLALLLICRK
jgi:hypothetical protein